jgi:hypothetical protein
MPRRHRASQITLLHVPLRTLRIYPNLPHLVQNLIQHLTLRTRFPQHPVLETLAILPLPLMKPRRRRAPIFFPLLVYIRGNASAFLDPFNLRRDELCFVFNDT